MKVFSQSVGSIFWRPALLDLPITSAGENMVGFVPQCILLGKTAWLVFFQEFRHRWYTGVLQSYLMTRWFVEDAAQIAWEWCYSRSLHGWCSRRDDLERGLPPPPCIDLALKDWVFFPVFGSVYCCCLGLSLFIHEMSNASLNLWWERWAGSFWAMCCRAIHVFRKVFYSGLCFLSV